ncbi:hypothetical protein DRA42_00580 [Ethanoligenens harbinense]|nr:hypothetical protein CXQ68_00570 [Ethanoligenens harbinense YUAN-3]QCN91121.1 hypothetical protein DRA42_00580 [Ethanoligenens harbinense]
MAGGRNAYAAVLMVRHQMSGDQSHERAAPRTGGAARFALFCGGFLSACHFPLFSEHGLGDHAFAPYELSDEFRHISLIWKVFADEQDGDAVNRSPTEKCQHIRIIVFGWLFFSDPG